MSDCIFCRIIKGEIPADKIYEDELAIVIRDIAPQAPFHFLAIPKKHYPAVHDIPPAQMGEIVGGLMNASCRALEICGIGRDGYRLVANSGEIAGQTVPHLHIHVLGGRELAWPPG
jgi:histidine triad (HIT) family protein